MANTLRSEGYSLWLVPAPSSSLFTTVQTLIHTSIPSAYPDIVPPRFSPHVTLTGGTIHLQPDVDPGRWLQSFELTVTKDPLKVIVRELHVGDIFFQKLIMLCEKSDALCELAAYCRTRALGNEDGVKEWIKENYRPHCSLM